MWIRSLKVSVLIMCSLTASAVPTGISFSKDKPGSSQAAGKTKNAAVNVAVDIFAGKDREIIKSYFEDHADGLPPGLAKRGQDLPPGLQKQLRRKGHLPPGLEKKLVPFPVELERKLPPLRPGLVRGVIEGHGVIFNSKTSVILDVFAIW